MPLQPNQLLRNKYRIVREIGQGAFGRVWLAQDTLLDRQVAIKALLTDDMPSGQGSSDFSQHAERFRREAKTQAAFNHSHIVHAYELIEDATKADDGTITSRLFLVMEFIDGQSLKSMLEDKGKLDAPTAQKFFVQLLDALEEVHDHPLGIVHRDLKPSNLLITTEEQLKLSDFGLAQVADESQRSSRETPHPGSPLYMSPEQSATVGYLYECSDLFSAGCVLFEMLTGQIYKRFRPKKLAKVWQEIPAEWHPLLKGLLQQDLDERLQDVEEARELLTGTIGVVATTPPVASEPVQPRTSEEEHAHQLAQAEAEANKRQVKLQTLLDKATSAADSAQWQDVLQLTAQIDILDVQNPKGLQLASRAKVAIAEAQAAAKQAKREADARANPAGIKWAQVMPGGFRFGIGKRMQTIKQAYLVGLTPITNAQYQRFIDSHPEQRAPLHWNQDTRQHPEGTSQHAVVQVSWQDVQAFCVWAKVRLPSELEWEHAARGQDGRIYPWGDSYASNQNCNFNKPWTAWQDGKALSPVGAFSPQGDSPFGCVDMAGNVWEWCADWFSPDATRLIRGGSWNDNANDVKVTARHGLDPDLRYYHIGFRVVRDYRIL